MSIWHKILPHWYDRDDDSQDRLNQSIGGLVHSTAELREAETIASIVAWLRSLNNAPGTPHGFADEIENGTWRALQRQGKEQ